MICLGGENIKLGVWNN